VSYSRPTASRKGTILLAVLVVLIAAALRLPGLDLKPLHSDEGVNGWFTLRLHWWNVYRYRPSDYHGPFLYYVNLLFFRLLGPGEVSLRLGTALAGTMVPIALLPLSRYLGLLGLACAGLLLSVSPTMVYFARTNIHETWLVLGSILWAAGLLRYCSRPQMRWALLASGGAALCFVNKETALLTGGSLVAGLGLAWLMGAREAAGERLDDPDLFSEESRAEALASIWRGGRWSVLAGVSLFVLVIVFFFSSMCTWFPGVIRFIEAFGLWVGHGVTGRNQAKDWDYFLKLMLVSNGGVLLCAALVSGLLAVLRRHRVGLFFFAWTLSAALVYSAIPYKTPWCVLSIELPLFLSVGWLTNQLVLLVRDSLLGVGCRLAAVFGIFAVLYSAVPMVGETLAVSRDGFDDDENAYVFVQTERGYYRFLQDLFGVGDQIQSNEGRSPRVLNVDPKNPTRWYTITRGWTYKKSDYLNGRLPRAERLEDAEVVLCTGRNARSLGKLLADSEGDWHRELYELRPGVRLWVWFRSSWWDAYQRAGGRAVSPWPRPALANIRRPPLPRKFRE